MKYEEWFAEFLEFSKECLAAYVLKQNLLKIEKRRQDFK